MDAKMMRFGWATRIGHRAGPEMGEQCWFRPDVYIQLLQMIEAAGVEFAVLAESTRPTLNPMMLAGAVSSATSRIGIVPELPTTDYPPFKMARLLCTLNHMTRGRIGWSMDTTVAQRGAHQYGLAAGPPDTLRHEIADEYVDVCKKLWSSWAPGAVVEDVESGVFADASKVRAIHHEGAHFKVRGPLNMTNEPYDRPLLVQTVHVDGERRFAARHADVAIIAGPDAATLAAQREKLLGEAVAQGRDPESIRTYFSIALQMAETVGGRASWPTHPEGGLTLAGTPAEVATALEEVFDASRCDGIVIQGNWSSVQINMICNQMLGLLRRRGRLAPRQATAGLLTSLVESTAKAA